MVVFSPDADCVAWPWFLRHGYQDMMLRWESDYADVAATDAQCVGNTGNVIGYEKLVALSWECLVRVIAELAAYAKISSAE